MGDVGGARPNVAGDVDVECLAAAPMAARVLEEARLRRDVVLQVARAAERRLCGWVWGERGRERARVGGYKARAAMVGLGNGTREKTARLVVEGPMTAGRWWRGAGREGEGGGNDGAKCAVSGKHLLCRGEAAQVVRAGGGGGERRLGDEGVRLGGGVVRDALVGLGLGLSWG